MTTWCYQLTENSGARKRLLCFPHAGAGVYPFRSWIELLSEKGGSSLDLWAVCLPGREMRFREPLVKSLDQIVLGVIEEIREWELNIPWFVFGHSMGSLISYKLCCELVKQSLSLPRCLFVSGMNAPVSGEIRGNTHQLPDEFFWQEVRNLRGASDEIFDNHEMRDIILPILKSDFSLVENYMEPQEVAKLPIDIVVVSGADDQKTSPDGLRRWKEKGIGEFHIQMFERGGHFYIHDMREELVAFLKAEIDSMVCKG